MTKLLISIELYEQYKEFCGNCYFQDIVNENEWYCRCFRKFLQHNKDQSLSRSPECLEAEKAAKEVNRYENCKENTCGK